MERDNIVNADEKLTIHVTFELTKNIRRKNPYRCVFAEACTKLPEVEEAIVHLSTAYVRFRGEDKWTRFRVQSNLRTQIINFDKSGSFVPGFYTLSTLQPSHRARGKRQGTFGNGGKTHNKRGPRAFIKGVRAAARIASL